MKKNKLKEGALDTGIQSYQTSSVAPKTSSSSGGKKPTLNIKKNDLTKVMPQLKGDDVNVNVVEEEEDVNEVNFLKKAALAGALATSAISGNAQQKTDKFVEFKQSESINKDFKSFDDVNSWLKQIFDGNTKWDISSISIKSKDNLFKISIDRKKSNTGYDKLVLAVNKEGNPTESRNNVLSKNPNSKEINSGEINFKGISYDWFLIGLKTNDANYSSGVSKMYSDSKINESLHKDTNKKYQYVSDIVDENGELSKPFTINGKNYQMVRALNPKNEKVLGVYSLDEVDEEGNNVIHDVDEFEKTIDDNQMQTETGVQEPEGPEANTLNPEGPVAETSDEAKLEHPSFAGHKHFIVNKKTGKARKFKDISELAKANMTPDEQYMGIKDFKKYVDETLFGAGRKQNLDEVQPTGQESDEEMNVKAKRLMDMIKKKIPQGIIDTIVTPVAQREVIAAFAEMIGVPRNGLSKLIAGLKDLALAKKTPTAQPTAQPTAAPTTQATGAVQENRKIIQTIKVKDLNNVNI